jgi:HEAT repeat protein
MNSPYVPMDLPKAESALEDCKSLSVNGRLNAARGLAIVDKKYYPEAVDALLGLLKDISPEVRTQAVESLYQLALCGAQVADFPVKALLNDESLQVRCAVLEDLYLFDNGAFEYAKDAAEDVQPGIRLSAARLMSSLQDKRAIDVLTHLLEDADEIVANEAALALASFGSNAGGMRLQEMVLKRSQDAVLAAQMIGSLKLKEAAQILKDVLDGWFVNNYLRGMCAAALACMDEPAYILKILKSKVANRRIAALQALSLLPVASLSDALENSVCKAKNKIEKSLAAEAIFNIAKVDKEVAVKSLTNIKSVCPSYLLKEIELSLKQLE